MSCCTGTPISSVREFLRELVMLARQDDTAAPTVLELQIGDVISRTTVESFDGADHLVVVASLPASGQSPFHSALPGDAVAARARAQGAIISWDADAGCYVVTRRIPARDLQDDRSVMDAILATVDEAIGWQDLLEKVYLRQRGTGDASGA